MPSSPDPRPPIFFEILCGLLPGDPTPSHADVEMTKAIVSVCQVLGIAVHDHVIIAKQGHASFKELKLM